MAYVGHVVDDDVMYLCPGRDFVWRISFATRDGMPWPIADGVLFFEFDSGPVWPFRVDGAVASMCVPAAAVAGVSHRERWRLVFLPAVGDEVTLGGGIVRVSR